jgi:D-alanyl-D-alanine carboxypeptidase
MGPNVTPTPLPSRRLEAAGVRVLAEAVAENPVGKLPPRDTYADDDLVATLVSLPYADYAKLILKVGLDK